MKFEDIDYVEFYVENARSAAHFYSSTFGFRVVAELQPVAGEKTRHSYLLQQGTTRLLLTSAWPADGQAAEYVERHGDGVKDIALRTPNAVRAFEEALRRGALPVREPAVYSGAGTRVIRATVAAPIGDLVHTFIQREGHTGAFMPGVFRETHDFSPPGIEPFAALDHIAICLEPGTLRKTVQAYEQIFGFHLLQEENVRSEYSGMNSQVVQSPNGRITFPMMEPAPGSRRGQIEEFLASHGGPGVQHLALLSDDIVTAIQQLRSRYVEFLDIPGPYYDALPERLGKLPVDLSTLRTHGILADRDASGVLLQTFTRSMHPRRTLFFEAIQRLDARGFGAGNIRALFEAKEREQTTYEQPSFV